MLAGRFRIVSLLGAGGMGTVYTAEDTLLHTAIALKVIHPRSAAVPEARALMRSELLMGRLVTDPGVCRLYDAAECELDGETILFLTMELLRGETMSERLSRKPRLTLSEAQPMAHQLAKGLSTLHRSNVVHGDLKPANIMLTLRDGNPQAVLMDFGLAHNFPPQPEGDTEARSGSAGGTPEYMAPELSAGGVASREGDIFALGLVLAQLLTYLPVGSIIEDSTAPKAKRSGPSVAARATLRQAGGPWLRAVERCLDADPAKRYASAIALSDALAGVPRTVSPWRIAAAATVCLTAVLMGFAWWVLHIPTSDVAVLPFSNATGDPALNYAAEGISGSLQQNLVRVGGLTVASWSADLGAHPATGKRLRARGLISGKLTREGRDLVLDVELMNASNGKRLWSRRYRRPDTALIDMEESVLADVSPRLLRHPSANGSVRTPDPAAYDLYLRGFYLMNRRSPTDFEAAAELFNESIRKDPAFALPHAGLTAVYWMFVMNGMQANAVLAPQMKAHALRALELDPALPEAHYAYAMALTVEYDWKGAEREFRRAIRLNPQFAESHSKLAVAVLAPTKRFEEAILEAKRAVDLAPNDPFQRWTFAYVLYQSRHFDIILSQLGQYAHEPMPNDSMVRLMTGAVKGMALIGAGRPAEAVAATQEASYSTPPPNALAAYFYATRGVRGNALALLGRRREAEQIVREMLETNGSGAQPCNVATVYAALGNREAAIGQLNRCYEIKAPGLPFITTDVRYDSLRSDPRFRALLTKIGLQ